MHPNAPSEAPHIVLVEDNPADIELIRIILKKYLKEYKLTVWRDGEECLDNFEAAAPWNLLLLDLNLPKIDGRAVLKAIKSNKNTLVFPVVVVSTSNAPADVSFVYAHYGNAYLQKSAEFTKFEIDIKATLSFWLEKASIPVLER